MDMLDMDDDSVFTSAFGAEAMLLPPSSASEANEDFTRFFDEPLYLRTPVPSNQFVSHASASASAGASAAGPSSSSPPGLGRTIGLGLGGGIGVGVGVASGSSSASASVAAGGDRGDASSSAGDVGAGGSGAASQAGSGFDGERTPENVPLDHLGNHQQPFQQSYSSGFNFYPSLPSSSSTNYSGNPFSPSAHTRLGSQPHSHNQLHLQSLQHYSPRFSQSLHQHTLHYNHHSQQHHPNHSHSHSHGYNHNNLQLQSLGGLGGAHHLQIPLPSFSGNSHSHSHSQPHGHGHRGGSSGGNEVLHATQQQAEMHHFLTRVIDELWQQSRQIGFLSDRVNNLSSGNEQLEEIKQAIRGISEGLRNVTAHQNPGPALPSRSSPQAHHHSQAGLGMGIGVGIQGLGLPPNEKSIGVHHFDRNTTFSRNDSTPSTAPLDPSTPQVGQSPAASIDLIEKELTALLAAENITLDNISLPDDDPFGLAQPEAAAKFPTLTSIINNAGGNADEAADLSAAVPEASTVDTTARPEAGAVSEGDTASASAAVADEENSTGVGGAINPSAASQIEQATDASQTLDEMIARASLEIAAQASAAEAASAPASASIEEVSESAELEEGGDEVGSLADALATEGAEEVVVNEGLLDMSVSVQRRDEDEEGSVPDGLELAPERAEAVATVEDAESAVDTTRKEGSGGGAPAAGVSAALDVPAAPTVGSTQDAESIAAPTQPIPAPVPVPTARAPIKPVVPAEITAAPKTAIAIPVPAAPATSATSAKKNPQISTPTAQIQRSAAARKTSTAGSSRSTQMLPPKITRSSGGAAAVFKTPAPRGSRASNASSSASGAEARQTVSATPTPTAPSATPTAPTALPATKKSAGPRVSLTQDILDRHDNLSQLSSGIESVPPSTIRYPPLPRHLLPTPSLCITASATRSSKRSAAASVERGRASNASTGAAAADLLEGPAAEGVGGGSGKRRKIRGRSVILPHQFLPMSDGEKTGVKWDKKGPNTEKTRMQEVSCDMCQGRVHWACAGLGENDNLSGDPWVCPDCVHSLDREDSASASGAAPVRLSQQERCLRPDCIMRSWQRIIRTSSHGDNFHFERIIGRKLAGRGRNNERKFLYLIKWENYPVYDCTWEPPKHIPNINEHQARFLQSCREEGIEPHFKITLLEEAVCCWNEKGLRMRKMLIRGGIEPRTWWEGDDEDDTA